MAERFGISAQAIRESFAYPACRGDRTLLNILPVESLSE
jgi:hypothetical protein